MFEANELPEQQTDRAQKIPPWISPLAAALVGATCAALGGHLVGATPLRGSVFGALFGFCFCLLFRKRAA